MKHKAQTQQNMSVAIAKKTSIDERSFVQFIALRHSTQVTVNPSKAIASIHGYYFTFPSQRSRCHSDRTPMHLLDVAGITCFFKSDRCSAVV